ncbi:hypothetical protein JCM5353_004071 [Sporobolomyces roseus]
MGLPWLFPLWIALQKEADYFLSVEGKKEWASRNELKAKEKQKLEKRYEAAGKLMEVMEENGGKRLYKEFDSIEKAWKFMEGLFPGRTFRINNDANSNLYKSIMNIRDLCRKIQAEVEGKSVPNEIRESIARRLELKAMLECIETVERGAPEGTLHRLFTDSQTDRSTSKWKEENKRMREMINGILIDCVKEEMKWKEEDKEDEKKRKEEAEKNRSNASELQGGTGESGGGDTMEGMEGGGRAGKEKKRGWSMEKREDYVNAKCSDYLKGRTQLSPPTSNDYTSSDPVRKEYAEKINKRVDTVVARREADQAIKGLLDTHGNIDDKRIVSFIRRGSSVEEIQQAEIDSGRTQFDVRDGEDLIEIIYSGDSDHFILHRCTTAQLHLSCIWSDKLKKMVWRVVDLRVRDRLVKQWWFKTVSQQLWAAHLIGGETSEGIVGVGPKTYFQNADLRTLDAESSQWKLALRSLERGESPQNVPDTRSRRKPVETVATVDALNTAYNSRLRSCFKKKITILLTLQQLCDTVDSAELETDPLEPFTKLDVLRELVFTALEHEMKGKEVRFGGEGKGATQPSNHRFKFKRINPLKPTPMKVDTNPSSPSPFIAPSPQRVPPKHCVDRSHHTLPPSTISLRTIDDEKLPRAYKVESGVTSEWLHKARRAQEAEENGEGQESGRDTGGDTSSSDSNGGGRGGRKRMEIDKVDGKDESDDDEDEDDGSDGMNDGMRAVTTRGGGGSRSQRNSTTSSTTRPSQTRTSSSSTRPAPPPTTLPPPSNRATRSSAKQASAPKQSVAGHLPLPTSFTTATSTAPLSTVAPLPGSTLPIGTAPTNPAPALGFIAPPAETPIQRQARKGKGKAVEEEDDGVKRNRPNDEKEAASIRRMIADAEEKEKSSKELARRLLVAFGFSGPILDAPPRYAVDHSASTSRPSLYFTTDQFEALVVNAIPFLGRAFPLHLSLRHASSTGSLYDSNNRTFSISSRPGRQQGPIETSETRYGTSSRLSRSEPAPRTSSAFSRPFLSSTSPKSIPPTSSDSSRPTPLASSSNPQSRPLPSASSIQPPSTNSPSSAQSPPQGSSSAVNPEPLPSRRKRQLRFRNPLPPSSDVNQSDSDSTEPPVKKRKVSRLGAVQTRRLSMKALMQPSKYSSGTMAVSRKRQKIVDFVEEKRKMNKKGKKPKQKGGDAKSKSDGLGVKGDIYSHRSLQVPDNGSLYRKNKAEGITETPKNHLCGDRQHVDQDLTAVAKVDLESIKDIQEAVLRQRIHDESASFDGLLEQKGRPFVNYIQKTVAGVAWLYSIEAGEEASSQEVDDLIESRGRDPPTRVKENWKRCLLELRVWKEEIEGFFSGKEINECGSNFSRTVGDRTKEFPSLLARTLLSKLLKLPELEGTLPFDIELTPAENEVLSSMVPDARRILEKLMEGTRGVHEKGRRDSKESWRVFNLVKSSLAKTSLGEDEDQEQLSNLNSALIPPLRRLVTEALVDSNWKPSKQRIDAIPVECAQVVSSLAGLIVRVQRKGHTEAAKRAEARGTEEVSARIRKCEEFDDWTKYGEAEEWDGDKKELGIFLLQLYSFMGFSFFEYEITGVTSSPTLVARVCRHPDRVYGTSEDYYLPHLVATRIRQNQESLEYLNSSFDNPLPLSYSIPSIPAAARLINAATNKETPTLPKKNRKGRIVDSPSQKAVKLQNSMKKHDYFSKLVSRTSEEAKKEQRPDLGLIRGVHDLGVDVVTPEAPNARFYEVKVNDGKMEQLVQACANLEERDFLLFKDSRTFREKGGWTKYRERLEQVASEITKVDFRLEQRLGSRILTGTVTTMENGTKVFDLLDPSKMKKKAVFESESKGGAFDTKGVRRKTGVHLGMDHDVCLENYLSEKPRFREAMKQFTLEKIVEVVHPSQQDVGTDLKRIRRHAREEDLRKQGKTRNRTPLAFFVAYQQTSGNKAWRVKPNPAYWSSKSRKKIKRDELALPLYKRGPLGDSNSKSSRALRRGQEALEVWDKEMGIKDDGRTWRKRLRWRKSITLARHLSPASSSLTSLEDLPSTSPTDSPDSSHPQALPPFDGASSAHEHSLAHNTSPSQAPSASNDSPPERNEPRSRDHSPTPSSTSSSLTSLEDLPSPSESSSRPVDLSDSDSLPLNPHPSPSRKSSRDSPLHSSNPSTKPAAPPRSPSYAKVSVVGCDLGTRQYVAGVVIRENHVQFWKQGSTDQTKRAIVDSKVGQADGKLSEESHLAQILTGEVSHLSYKRFEIETDENDRTTGQALPPGGLPILFSRNNDLDPAPRSLSPPPPSLDLELNSSSASKPCEQDPAPSHAPPPSQQPLTPSARSPSSTPAVPAVAVAAPPVIDQNGTMFASDLSQLPAILQHGALPRLDKVHSVRRVDNKGFRKRHETSGARKLVNKLFPKPEKKGDKELVLFFVGKNDMTSSRGIGIGKGKLGLQAVIDAIEATPHLELCVLMVEESYTSMFCVNPDCGFNCLYPGRIDVFRWSPIFREKYCIGCKKLRHRDYLGATNIARKGLDIIRKGDQEELSPLLTTDVLSPHVRGLLGKIAVTNKKAMQISKVVARKVESLETDQLAETFLFELEGDGIDKVLREIKKAELDEREARYGSSGNDGDVAAMEGELLAEEERAGKEKELTRREEDEDAGKAYETESEVESEDERDDE